MREEFVFRKRVYLKDVNIFGNVYFSKYFEWQGEAREEFFRKLIGKEKALISNIKLVTLEASVRFIQEARLFDEIEIKIKVSGLTLTTVSLEFRYICRKRLLAEGKQKVGFLDIHTNKVLPIPSKLKEKWRRFLKSKK